MNKTIVKVLPVAAMVFTLASCNKSGYHVDLVATHGKWNGSTTAHINENYSAKYVPEAGYIVNPGDLVITVNNDIIEEKGYTFKDNNLVINKEYVIGNITIKIDPSAVEYNFEFVEEGDVTTIGASTPEGNPKYHTNFKVKFAEFFESYRLPDDMNVYVENTKLAKGQYDYDPTARTLMIHGEYVTGNVLISATAIELISMNFSGNGGTWVGGKDVQTVYVDKGATFKTAKGKIVGALTNKDPSKQFGIWVDEKDQEISDDAIVTDKMTAKATWVTKQLNVEVDDNHSYFPTDYWQQQQDPKRQTIDYGEALELTFKIKDGDETRYCIPQNIRDVRVGGNSLILGVDYTYTYTASPESGTLNINAAAMTGDVIIELYTPAVASIYFNPGEGTWDGKSADEKIASVRLGDVYDYSVYEAFRMIAKLKTDPIANNPNMKFVGWALQDDLDKKLIDENAIVTREMKLVAQYEEIDFENDTWENVITYADQGLDALYDHYKTSEANIVGSLRTIIAGNDTQGYVKEKVRLIGVNHDIIADEGKYKGEKASLTFEYCNSPFENQLDGKDAKYTTSALYKTMAGLITNLPSELQKAIHTVEKKTFNPTTNSYDITNDKLFLLSANELGLQSSDMPGGASVKPGEGEPYAQYIGADAGKRVKGNSFKYMESEGYWIRSVDYSDYGSDNTKAYSIDAAGKPAISSCTATLGAPFAFAIGANVTPPTSHEGTITFTNCYTTDPDLAGGKFEIKNDTADVLSVKAIADDKTGLLFPDKGDDCVTITSKAGEVKVINYTPSENHKSADIYISYDKAAAAITNDIAIDIKANQHYGTVETVNCTIDGETSFPVISGKAGNGHITATVTDVKYAFTEAGSLSYDSKGGVVTFTNIAVSGEGDSIINFDYSYSEEASVADLIKIIITASPI